MFGRIYLCLSYLDENIRSARGMSIYFNIKRLDMHAKALPVQNTLSSHDRQDL